MQHSHVNPNVPPRPRSAQARPGQVPPRQNAPQPANRQPRRQANAPHVNNPASRRPAQSRPARPAPAAPINAKIVTESRGPHSKFSNLSERIGGQASIKQILLSTLAFFALFIILAAFKFTQDYSRFKVAETDAFQADMTGNALGISRGLDQQVIWMDTALSLGTGPQRIIDFVIREPRILGAALLDSTGKPIAATAGAGEPFSRIDRRNFPKSNVKITSLINDQNIVTPVIARKSGDAYLVIALTPGALIGADASNRVIIMDGGRIIDGRDDIAKSGALGYYQINARQLNELTKSSNGDKVLTHSVGGNDVWLGSARIPNSNLTVLDTLPRSISPSLSQNIMLFALLFCGTAWLIWTLMSHLLKQLDHVRDQRENDEISRRRYQAAIDNARGGVWEIDLARNNAYLSPSLSKLFGMPERETTITLPQFLGLFMAHDREKLYNTIKRCHVTGEFDMDLNLAHLPVSLAANGKPHFRSHDHAKMVIGMALDVTETRGSQMRLQAAEARLHDALASMSDSFVIWDQMDRLVLWNTKFEDFFGFVPGNLQQGLEHSMIAYHADQAIQDTYVLQDGISSEIHLKDGRWIRYLETHTADGGRVSIGTDVTAIRSREYELQVNQDALERTIGVLKKSQVRIVELAENYEQEKIRAEDANHSKSEFLANMSHELRTPLNAINGFSDIMKKELFGPLGDPRYKEYVSDILFSGQHLLSLINDILDMSKIEAGKMTLNVEAMQVSDMIHQVLRIVRGRAEENRLKLVHDDNIEAPEIEADPRAVKQILLNLTTNAIKFTPEGGVVRVAVEPKSAGLIIRVSDTGIGISEEDILRLAQPFEQIESQHARKHEGTGLGLALSKSLIELHGGNFKIESVVGQGTTVVFTLPSSPPKQKKVTPDTEVGNEISRLAQDIAEVLNEGSVADVAAIDHAPVEMSAHPMPMAASQPTTATPPPFAGDAYNAA